MLINSSNLDALFISFSKNFNDAYMQSPAPLLDAIGSRIASNTRDQRYPIVQSISGAMRKWQGSRQGQNIVVDGFVVTNSVWENTLEILRTDVEDDQYGVYSDMLIPNLARHAKLLPDQQIAAAITGNATGYDGKAFFASDHAVDPSGQTSGTAMSNLLGGKPLNSTNLASVQATMMNYLGPDGLPMGCYGDTLLVPPSLKYTADTLANATFFPDSKNAVTGTFGAQSNMFQGQYKVVATPWIPDTGDATTATWYLLDCRDQRTRPFFWQEREAPQLVSKISPTDDNVFFDDKYVMGVRARGAAASALWFKAVKVAAT